MTVKTSNEIAIRAPLSFVWEKTNDLTSWPELFSEYETAEILETKKNYVKFRLTMFPDENDRVWSWVSERFTDPNEFTVRARRVETGPFEHMDIFWSYHVEGDSTRMHWRQEFEMKPSAPIDDAGMERRINENSVVQLELIKSKLEAAFAESVSDRG